MARSRDDTTAAAVLAAYEALVALASPTAPNRCSGVRDPAQAGDMTSRGAAASREDADLPAEARRMREAFERRTGAFGPEDPWFEIRSRAFWDDALTTQRFAELAGPRADATTARIAARFSRAHRGLFVIDEVDETRATLTDLWSGAELYVRHLDETQRVTLTHAEGALDGRVVACRAGDVGGDEVDAARASDAVLFLLPGAIHHGSDATEALERVLRAARERDLSTLDALDAVLRMELVFRSSSRVKASFAYRVESLPRASSAWRIAPEAV